ncbi:MAG: tRNA (adenosine(37)-N6)-threonylcarbamoyltransferase complex transferase subunit TsaD [Candidatus Komeilibacteria bacterium]|nr:tRNA (adenosine(37)-N6)-threonylcarbamoyltransferase complex transferase subunit TsaD [Candidatus Komeilibacteria bacterium]
MKILGIETSCDETAASLLEVKNGGFNLLSNVVLSQTEIHKKYGGIVPEVAARAHLEAINFVIAEALGKTIKPDLIAVTKGPGLITSLAVGVQTAKTLSYIWQAPLIGVNHLAGHLWSFLLNRNSQFEILNSLPAVALIVSGGHTELVLVKGIGKYKLIGQTLDDAAGEAFDKVAKMLGLGYPGGPIVSHFTLKGNKDKIKFPRPMLASADFDFSFSGLKTSVKYFIRDLLPKGNLSQQMICDICASFQAAVIEVLAAKTVWAAEKYKVKSIILGGGVSANEELAQRLRFKAQNLNINCLVPEKWLTGDNAAMIALAGYFNLPSPRLRQTGLKKSSKSNWKKLNAEANLRLV